MQESKIEKIDIRGNAINVVKGKEINKCEALELDGTFNNSGLLDIWDNVKELVLDEYYEHRYFLVWNNTNYNAPEIRRLKK